jgi:hypothetical protein
MHFRLGVIDVVEWLMSLDELNAGETAAFST